MNPATKAALFLADKAGIDVPKPVRVLADPIGSAIEYFGPKVNEALGAAPGTAEAVINPKGFAKGLARDIGKDYISDRGEIPEEDRSFASNDTKSAMSNTYSDDTGEFKRGGKVKSKAKSTPKASSASRRGDGIAQRGKTRGRYM
jgi:hypothetical protein